MSVTNEQLQIQTRYPSRATRTSSFSAEIRARDKKCSLTGRAVFLSRDESWGTFDAAHIFPLRLEEHWSPDDHSDGNTNPPPGLAVGSINSPRNGFLLCCAAHRFFDLYQVTVNPDV